MSFGNTIGSVKQAMATAVPASESQASRGKTAGAPTQATSDTKPDAANLSSASNLVAQAIAGSDVRAVKVEALQKAIADGSYNVSSSVVADKIIQSMTE